MAVSFDNNMLVSFLFLGDILITAFSKITLYLLIVGYVDVKITTKIIIINSKVFISLTVNIIDLK